MQVFPIRTDADCDRAARRVAELMDAEPGSDRFAELDAWATLLDAYESRRFPAVDLDPPDFLKAHMEVNGYTKQDLAEVLGSQPRASEVLNRSRALTLDMIRALEAAWGVPAAVLVRRYELRGRPVPQSRSRRRPDGGLKQTA